MSQSSFPKNARSGTAPDEAAVPGGATLRRNFTLLVLHGLFGQAGFRLVQAPTFLPHFVGQLAGNASAVGILRGVQSFGMFLSPILSASVVESRSRARGLGILFGGAMRLQILALALIALFVPVSQALPFVWTAVALLGLALGVQGVVFNFMISKTVPVERRGRLLGIRNVAAGIVSVGAAVAGGILVDRAGFPAGYGYTFLIAFVLSSCGLVAFGLLREPDSVEVRTRLPLGERLSELPGLLRSEPGFRRFLVARLFGMAARGAVPMYVLFLAREYGVTGYELGFFTMTFLLAQSFGGLGWGLLADRTGFKGVFQGALLVWASATLLLLLAPSATMAYPVYLLVGAGVGGFLLGGQNLVLEFGTQRDRPMRIAMTNSSSELVGTAGFLGAGLLADQAGLELVFWISIALQAAAVLVIRRMQEPRVAVEPQVDDV